MLLYTVKNKPKHLPALHASAVGRRLRVLPTIRPSSGKARTPRLRTSSEAHRVPGSGEEVVGAAAEAEAGAEVELHIWGQQVENSPVHVVRRAIVHSIRERQHIPLVKECRPLVHRNEGDKGLVIPLEALGGSTRAQVGDSHPQVAGTAGKRQL